MIRKIEVDGFKTLSDFVMELKPGLDILVGPNGSGKTNIISFFEFLGFLQDSNVSDAVSNAGGAGSIFRKVGGATYQSYIAAHITGLIKVRSRKYVYYKYSFKIDISESGESIRYSEQRLQVKRKTTDSMDEKKIGSYDLDVEKFVGDDLAQSVNVRACTEEIDKEIPASLSRGRRNSKMMEDLLNHAPSDRSLASVVLRSLSWELYRPIYADIKGGQVYNIEPSKAKIPDDSAKNPGVSKDGSGLYSTLYAIQKREKYGLRRPYTQYGRQYEGLFDAKMDDVIKYTQLANQWISKIEIINNPFDKQLQIKVSVVGGKRDTVLPLSAMSDGTVKWIALITIILTNRTMFSIEEPENYLHPLMLSEIISIIRTNMRKERFVLMSTHSETLINSATPEEVIVVSYHKGKTTAKRVSNAEELSKEIRNTGFGLGYYFISGSFEHE